jgi:hypothetical protein
MTVSGELANDAAAPATSEPEANRTAHHAEPSSPRARTRTRCRRSPAGGASIGVGRMRAEPEPDQSAAVESLSSLVTPCSVPEGEADQPTPEEVAEGRRVVIVLTRSPYRTF